ncbi:hypothetical protein [Ruminococcus albus]|uniref:hypothetical protein n=1 Tax=Ruminococcus albus TaxID=1264 RepID=UPI000466FCF2|nr:hypothetical protein [Ruminococcus albus]
MISDVELDTFIGPYYKDKDIMHDMWHIELVRRQMKKIISAGCYDVNEEHLRLALAFHGFIYSHEQRVRDFLEEHGCSDEDIEKIVTISWESQRNDIPETLEGKILHDAHVLEGGKTYTVVKILITGSVRGQSLMQTLDYMKHNVLGANKCYLPETEELCKEMNEFTERFYNELSKDIAE